jgi:hypothetical protein
MCPFVCISAFVRGIVLIFHISHRPAILYKLRTFRFDRSIFTRTFNWRRKKLFCYISDFIGGNFLENYTSHFPRMRYNRCKFVLIGLKLRTLYVGNRVLRLYTGFIWRKFPVALYLTPPTHALQMA